MDLLVESSFLVQINDYLFMYLFIYLAKSYFKITLGPVRMLNGELSDQHYWANYMYTFLR